MEKFTCPLSSTEKRLKDCLLLIIETKNNYFDPNAFRLSLNNCIQTLRTVTFVLQKNKSLLSNFNEWYEPWQNQMRNDTILRWLIEARNTIVKQGDLVTHSMARVSVVESWYGSPILEMEVPPLTETYNFAKLLAQSTPNKEAYVVGLLRLERRWVDSKLPDYELLESSSYSYEILIKLLLDAHEHLISKASRSKCPWHIEAIKSEGKLPPFLLAQEWDRTVWIDIASGDIMEPANEVVEEKKEIQEEAARRYPGIEKRANKISSKSSIEDELAIFFEQAKTILKTDGHHATFVFIGYPDGHKKLCHLDMKDRTEKHLIFRSLAADIKKTGATSIILIGETWFASEGDARLTRTGVKSKSLKEALQMIGANAEGKIIRHQVFFTKDEQGKVHFGDEFTVNDDSAVNLIAPILEVWKTNKNL